MSVPLEALAKRRNGYEYGWSRYACLLDLPDENVRRVDLKSNAGKSPMFSFAKAPAGLE
ncbi:hypothetical protein [Bradyrhizobium sp. CCBAU 53421]|uniref:hypothetical protein n=1 Tax=Bradyrhizobium sp. CCBAU 53421 TaxID=1325120 RepID=UPI00188B9D38|nr:hypothetical protein [Bradyrhizobium sp. CCBAU 53421]